MTGSTRRGPRWTTAAARAGRRRALVLLATAAVAAATLVGCHDSRAPMLQPTAPVPDVSSTG
ncbi:hypothetical protein [Litorihabitans aurantiacus]|uniref:hypothetical protein n=1 Tax=Litorihabitans aurantiacus TaxID=1930061 RepID=UPI0024E10DEA|nr:hypothetical protein [Litorihabitans aurantiacus]